MGGGELRDFLWFVVRLECEADELQWIDGRVLRCEQWVSG
jgi:hypothetical protein